MNKFIVPPERARELRKKLKEWRGYESEYSAPVLTTVASGNVVRRLYGQIFKDKIKRA